MKFGPGNLKVKEVEGFYGGLYSRSKRSIKQEPELQLMRSNEPFTSPETNTTEFVTVKGIEKNDLLLILALFALSIVALSAIAAIKQ